jgi:hypothetical protein
MKIVTAEEMRAIDRATTEKYGVPSLTLMENAGAAVADFAQNIFIFSLSVSSSAKATMVPMASSPRVSSMMPGKKFSLSSWLKDQKTCVVTRRRCSRKFPCPQHFGTRDDLRDTEIQDAITVVGVIGIHLLEHRTEPDSRNAHPAQVAHF